MLANYVGTKPLNQGHGAAVALALALARLTLNCAPLSEEFSTGFIDNRRIASYAMRWATSPALAAKLPTAFRVARRIAQQPDCNVENCS